MSTPDKTEKKVEFTFNTLVGCFGILGALFAAAAILVMFVAPAPVIQVIQNLADIPTVTPVVITLPPPSPYPTYTPLPTYTSIPQRPSPTATGTPDPTESALRIGEVWIGEKVDIVVKTPIHLEEYFRNSWAFPIELRNKLEEELVVTYDASSFHARDDLWNEYPLSDWTRQTEGSFVLKGHETVTLIPDIYAYKNKQIPLFQGPIDPKAKYLLITIERLAGEENLIWRYDLP